MRLYFRGRRVRSVSRYTGRKVSSRRRPTPPPTLFSRLKQADRSLLLVTTALASTLVIGALFTPAPAAAVNCPQPPGGPIAINTNVAPITCVNVFDITNNAGDAINLHTDGNANFITLYNSGILTASDDGIDTSTTGDDSFITIDNVGDINASNYGGHGILAFTNGSANSAYSTSGIWIENSGDIAVGDHGTGISATTIGDAGGNHSDAGNHHPQLC